MGLEETVRELCRSGQSRDAGELGEPSPVPNRLHSETASDTFMRRISRLMNHVGVYWCDRKCECV